MTAGELSDLVKGIAPVLHGQIALAVSRAVDPLAQRMAALEQRMSAVKDGDVGEKGDRGDDGDDGESIKGDPGAAGESAYGLAVKHGFAGTETDWLASLKGPSGNDGAAGADGKHADTGAIVELAREVESLKRSLADVKTIEPVNVTQLMVDEVSQRLASLPAAKDVVGMSGGVIDRDGHLVLTLSDGTTKNLGVVVGRDGQQGPKGDPGESIEGPKGAKGDPGDSIVGPSGPKGDPGESITGPQGPAGAKGDSGESVKGDKGDPGRHGDNGKDGFGFNDFEETFDGERTFTRTYRMGDRVKTFTHRVSAVIYRGIFDATKTYEAGDQVTYAGCQWNAKQSTTGVNPDEHIPESKRAWTLSSKKGDRGRTGPVGPEGKSGPRGAQGDRGPDRW